MNIYEKLQKCRVDLQQMNIKKSGKNKFSGYMYFELGDFRANTPYEVDVRATPKLLAQFKDKVEVD